MDKENKVLTHNSLTPENKEDLRQMMGKFSGKVDLNRIRDILNDDYDDTYNEFVDEECYYCGKHLTSTKDMFIDEDDRYACGHCSEEYDLEVARCRPLDYEDIEEED